jgi:hypothetical protein
LPAKNGIIRTMNWLLRGRRWLARLLLRGRVMEWWLRRKARKLEARYCRELMTNVRGLGRGGSPAKTGLPLRRLLFIGDLQWETGQLAPELRKICELRLFDLHPHLKKKNDQDSLKQNTVVALDEFIRSQTNFEPDLTLLYVRPELLSEEAVNLLRRRWSCPLWGYNGDDKIEFFNYGVFASGNDDYQRWARLFDLNLSNVQAAVDWYSGRDLPVLYLPSGYYPKTTMPPASIAEFRREICFAGRCRPERDAFIRRLRRLGVPVETVGRGWPGSGEMKDLETIFRSSQLNLGIGWAAPSETLTSLKARDFECPGAGACYLTTYNWELQFHYELGKEILCYRSVEELVEMYSWYRRRPEECLKIAQAAWRRGLAEHTWEKRFRKVFRQAGFNA